MMEVFNQPSGKKKHLQETLSGWQMELEKKGWQHSTILSREESVYIDATHLVRKGLIWGQRNTSRLKFFCLFFKLTNLFKKR